MLDFLKGTVTPRDWAFVGVVVFLTAVLCAGFFFLVYARQQVSLNQVLEEVREIERDLLVARNTCKNFKDMQDESRKMEQLVASFENRLPEEREIPRLLEQFEKLGEDINLAVELLALPPLTDENKETIPYKVTTRGTFHQTVSFINLLERDERYLKISDLDIGEEEAGVSESTFTLSTFRFVQSELEVTP